MKFIEMIKNQESLWKFFIFAIVLINMIVLVVMIGGYNLTTKFGSIFKEDTEIKIQKKMSKIKTQTNYSIDMKINMFNELSKLYEEKLKYYCERNNISITNNQIENDVRYYKLIIIAMNDICEDLTISRYIHNNDLYRYSNQNDWNNFKENCIKLYMSKGTEILTFFYDNSKVIMPVQSWIQLGSKDIIDILTKNTNNLFENLRMESIIYNNYCIEKG